MKEMGFEQAQVGERRERCWRGLRLKAIPFTDHPDDEPPDDGLPDPMAHDMPPNLLPNQPRDEAGMFPF